jgi:hypothetical protein
MKDNPLEIVFYIHGVSNDRKGKSHDSEYQELHDGIEKIIGDTSRWPSVKGGAEWGWNYNEGAIKGHKALTDAQRRFGGKILTLVKESNDLTLYPSRWGNNKIRDVVFYGFGDMFYYVSETGKWSVRLAVAKQLVNHIEQRLEHSIKDYTNDPPISLTLIGHSAGSVIAIDFIYYLFNDTNKEWGKGSLKESLLQLRGLVKLNKLRIRRLITFGSPISLLAFRNDSVVEILEQNDHLNPNDYGFTKNLPNQPALQGARWINIWDKDDIISWPAAPLMQAEGENFVEDVYVDVSDNVIAVHNDYWSSKNVHIAIASRW